MMARMTRGRVAAALASLANGLLVLAVAYGVVAALGGAYALVVAPTLGTAIAVCVWASLRRVCQTGSRAAQATALNGIAALFAVAYLGISFGGALVVLPAASLALAAALTPRPRVRGADC
jgi:hypothetical protein